MLVQCLQILIVDHLLHVFPSPKLIQNSIKKYLDAETQLSKKPFIIHRARNS